jgi:AraC-like DNA-binding protein
MENLFYMEEHTSCFKYKSDFETGFRYREVNTGEIVDKLNTAYYHLIFLRNGLLKVHCNEFIDRRVQSEECVMIPRSAELSCEALRDSSMLVLSFDILQDVCDKAMIHSYRPYSTQTVYSFNPIAIRYPLNSFLDLLTAYLNGGIDCEHLHEIKQKELFIVLRRCYSKEEILSLLHPIIGISDFKNFILQNYQIVDHIGELADLSGMGRTAFDAKFREVFGIPPHQWILKRMAAQIQYKMMDPEVTIKDIMIEFKFNSATHFNRFCKQQFNCTPGELLKRSRSYRNN